MTEQFELDLPFNSRLKATSLFIKSGRAFFGIWNNMSIPMDGDEEEYVVQEGEEGQLELFALRAYGDGNHTLWWVIANANQIDFPLEQVVPGTRLKIPKPDNVMSALLSAAKRGEET